MLRHLLLSAFALTILACSSSPQKVEEDERAIEQSAFLDETDDASENALRERFAELQLEQEALREDIDAAVAELRGDAADLTESVQADLERFLPLILELERNYSELMEETSDPRLALGAVVRIGDSYWLVARYIERVPTPSNLSAEEQDAYQSIVDEYVVQIEGRALELYELASKQAERQGITGHPLVDRAEERLASAREPS